MRGLNLSFLLLAKLNDLDKKKKLREDWDEAKLDVMFTLTMSKFSNPALKELLLATGDLILVEGNNWGYRFWGVSRGSGLNHLGEILMTVRDIYK